MTYDGWCLVGPNGKPISPTFSPLRDDCWSKSYALLEHRPWMEQFWKKWKESQDAAREHGYRMEKVCIVRLEEK